MWQRDSAVKPAGGANVGVRPESGSGAKSESPTATPEQGVQSTALPPRVQDWRFEKQKTQDRIDALKRYSLEAQGWTASTPVLTARKQDAIDTAKKEIALLEATKLYYEESIEKLLIESGQLDRLEYILVGKVPTGNGGK